MQLSSAGWSQNVQVYNNNNNNNKKKKKKKNRPTCRRLTIFKYSAEVYEHVGEGLHLFAVLEQLGQVVWTARRCRCWWCWRRDIWFAAAAAAAAAAVRTDCTRRQTLHSRSCTTAFCNVNKYDSACEPQACDALTADRISRGHSRLTCTMSPDLALPVVQTHFNTYLIVMPGHLHV